ncbi:MAG TPA: hypothetical protein VKU02_11490 [Gemmataceae bacterium]|nr:hypothetical protein [Gemmataceae bacterium]
MSIREIFAKICKESQSRPVVRPSTVRVRPRLEALETRLTPSGGFTGDSMPADLVSVPTQVGSP